ncbi:MAG: hypothetical protein WAK96_13280, partial [Desulfobaccales bacterium]
MKLETHVQQVALGFRSPGERRLGPRFSERMKRLNLRTIWWWPGQDLNPFGLVKFFSLPGFIVITIVTGILVVLLTLRAQQMIMKKNEAYLEL